MYPVIQLGDEVPYEESTGGQSKTRGNSKRTINPRPCVSCSEAHVRCDIEPPYTPALCRRCNKRGLKKCPPHFQQPEIHTEDSIGESSSELNVSTERETSHENTTVNQYTFIPYTPRVSNPPASSPVPARPYPQNYYPQNYGQSTYYPTYMQGNDPASEQPEHADWTTSSSRS